MNISAPFIARPIATALLMVGLLLGGLAAYPLLPVAALPSVNYPTLQVTAQLPGADPQTMASSVATPLETQFGQIPGLTQMTSASALGYTQITLQFDLSRQIDGAVSDTLSAINAASSYLPPNLPYPPTINKVNPADTPILVLALTSDTLPLTTVDAYAENILLQKISQISGVGLVGIAGRQKPAIRIQLDPQALAARGLSLEDVRSVISVDNVDLPKGTLNSPRQSYTLNTNDQLFKPEAYGDLIIAYRNGSPVRVKDVGKAIDGPENNLIAAWFNKQRAIILPIQRSPGANVVATVDRIKAMMRVLKASMALTIATGFVVDDAVVVIENTVRHLEEGLSPMQAALKSAGEIGFTIISITLSLIAVFIPLFLMGGYVGELFREFAVAVSVALVLSLVIALTLTPMMCSRLLKPEGEQHGRIYRLFERGFDALLNLYEAGLKVVLRHRFSTLMVMFGTVALTGYLYTVMPKGFFPQQDTGLIIGFSEAAQDISYQAMAQRQQALIGAVLQDPAAASVGTGIGAGGGNYTTNTGRMLRRAAHARHRNRLRNPRAARLRHRRRTGAEPVLDALYHPRCLPLSRSS